MRNRNCQGSFFGNPWFLCFLLSCHDLGSAALSSTVTAEPSRPSSVWLRFLLDVRFRHAPTMQPLPVYWVEEFIGRLRFDQSIPMWHQRGSVSPVSSHSVTISRNLNAFDHV
jgi:hypothetical protein